MPPTPDADEALGPFPFYTWVDNELLRRRNAGEEPSSWAELGRATSTTESAFTRWKNREVRPSITMVRRVADALGFTPHDRLRLMVIAEILLPEEVEQVSPVPNADLLTDDEIWEQHEKRFRPRVPHVNG